MNKKLYYSRLTHFSSTTKQNERDIVFVKDYSDNETVKTTTSIEYLPALTNLIFPYLCIRFHSPFRCLW